MHIQFIHRKSNLILDFDLKKHFLKIEKGIHINEKTQ